MRKIMLTGRAALSVLAGAARITNAALFRSKPPVRRLMALPTGRGKGVGLVYRNYPICSGTAVALNVKGETHA